MIVAWVIMVLLSASVSLVSADEIPVSRFDAEGLTGWESKSFKGMTEYSVVKEEGRAVVKATSHAAASGMVKKVHFAPFKISLSALVMEDCPHNQGGRREVQGRR